MGTTALAFDGSSTSEFSRSIFERKISECSRDGVLTVAQAFLELMSSIEPTESQRTKASEQQQRVREQLETRLWLINTFLSGSYRRRTLIKPVTDIDLLALLDAAKHSLSLDGAGATKALDLVLTALDDAYPKTEKVRDPRCIVMQFAGTGIGFDIVPVVQFAEHEFWMPDENRGIWIRTNPKEVQRLVSEANQNLCGEWLVPLVKLLKAWKRCCNVPLRGFHLEALAYHALKATPKNEREGLQFLFERLAVSVCWPTPDIWPHGEPISGYLAPSDQNRAVALLANAAKIAREANEAEAAGQSDAAHENWYSLFGDCYPETGVKAPEAKSASLSDALRLVKDARAFSATSAGIIATTPGYAGVRSSTSHGGDWDSVESPIEEQQHHGATALEGPALDPYLEEEIERALMQFPMLARISVSTAASSPRLWPMKAGDEKRLYTVLVGVQRTNYGTSHEILVKIPRDMPAAEPRIYMLRQHVEHRPTSRRGSVTFVAKRAIKHQWKDGAMCAHALRDKWDGRLVTTLVHAADWLMRQEHYRRFGVWIGQEIDGGGRLRINGKATASVSKLRTAVSLRTDR